MIQENIYSKKGQIQAQSEELRAGDLGNCQRQVWTMAKVLGICVCTGMKVKGGWDLSKWLGAKVETLMQSQKERF